MIPQILVPSLERGGGPGAASPPGSSRNNKRLPNRGGTPRLGLQTACKLIISPSGGRIEPVCLRLFHKNSFGFIPYKSVHHALLAVRGMGRYNLNDRR